jgi:hypothetical protein
LKALTMESAMLYNLPILYGLYAIGAGLYCAVAPWLYESHWLPLDGIGTFLCGCVGSDLSIVSLLILTVVANSIYRLLLSLLRWVSPRIASHQQSVRFWMVTFGIILIVILAPLLALAIVDHRLEHWTILGLFSCLVYVAGVVVVYLSCLWLVGRRQRQEDDSDCAFVALIFLTTPAILAGTLALMVWEEGVERRSWWLWSTLVVPVVSACGFKGTRQKQSNNSKRSRTLVLLFVVVSMSRSILMRGNAFRVGHLVFVVATSELMFEAWDRLV